MNEQMIGEKITDVVFRDLSLLESIAAANPQSRITI
jgi:hypothetical protein